MTTLLITTITLILIWSRNTTGSTPNDTQITKDMLVPSPMFNRIMQITDPTYQKQKVSRGRKEARKGKKITWPTYVSIAAMIMITSAIVSTTIVIGATLRRNSQRRVYYVPPVTVTMINHTNKDTPKELPLMKLSPDKF